MYSGIEGRGERGIQACVFEEFTLRCRETWSPVIDRTCLLTMNLSCYYRLSLRKYYSNLSFLSYCLVKTFFQVLLSVCIQDGSQRLCRVCGLACRHLGFAMQVDPQMIGALIWTLKDLFLTKCTDYVAETWRELFRSLTAIMLRGLRRASTGT